MGAAHGVLQNDVRVLDKVNYIPVCCLSHLLIFSIFFIGYFLSLIFINLIFLLVKWVCLIHFFSGKVHEHYLATSHASKAVSRGIISDDREPDMKGK